MENARIDYPNDLITWTFLEIKNRKSYKERACCCLLKFKFTYNIRCPLQTAWVDLSTLRIDGGIQQLKDRLNAVLQFYYFVACIEKYIFIDTKAIDAFKQKYKLADLFALGDYLRHYFSLESFIKRYEETPLDIEQIYNEPTDENIDRLMAFLMIHMGVQEEVARYPSGYDTFIAKQNHQLFSKSPSVFDGYKIIRRAVNTHYLIRGVAGHKFIDYLENYCDQSVTNGYLRLFDFESLSLEVIQYIDVFKNSKKIFEDLLNQEICETIDTADSLISAPFPVVFVSSSKKIEEYSEEFRSREPLKLGGRNTYGGNRQSAQPKTLA